MRQVIAKFALSRTAIVCIGLAGLISIFGSYVSASVSASSRAALTHLLTASRSVQASKEAAPPQPKSVFTARDSRPLPSLGAGFAPGMDFLAYLRQPAFNASTLTLPAANPFVVCDPITLSYANQSVNINGSLTVNPATGPTNITSYAVQDKGGYTGSVTVNGSGVVSIPNANPAGTYTITIRATNNNIPAGCTPTLTADVTFMLTVNAPPTFTPAIGITRTAGGSVTPAEALNVKILDNLSDDITPLASLTVTINGGSSATVGGVTVNTLSRTNNMYFANIAAACNAATGQVPFTLSVTDGGGLTTTQLLTVTVFANPAPVLTYPNPMTPPLINQGGALTIMPATGPSDNVSVASLTIGNLSGYTGSYCIRGGMPACAMATPAGTVELSNAGPGGGTFTLSVNATDNCGLITPAQFTIKINAPPAISATNPAVRQGNPATNLTLANINDPEDPGSALTVTPLGAGPFTNNGVTLTNVAFNTATGALTADIAASCTATNATFNVTATDSNGLVTMTPVMVTVAPNTPPVLSYPVTVSVGAGALSTMISPSAGPSDNGTISTLSVQSYSGACGTLAINTTPGPNFGKLTLTNAPVMGMTCPVTIRAVDNCGGVSGTTDAMFSIKVTAPIIGISKTHTPIGAMVQPGEVALFQLNYSNTGDQDATGAMLAETVPANTTFEALASAPGWSCADGSPAGTPCTYNIGNIGIGGSGTVFFAVRVVNPVGIGVTQVTNQFTYSDSIIASAMSNVDSVPIIAFPDMAVAKSDHGISSMAGGTVVYDLGYSNVGRRNAAGVVLTEFVPANTTFNATASLPSVWSCADGSPVGTMCTINIGNVAGGGSGLHKFAVDVAAILPLGVVQITNTASISESSGTDPVPANNSSTDTTPVGNGLILSPVAVGRTQGSPATNSTIATATDVLAPVSSVNVIVTSLPPGISVTNITHTPTGTINADVAASCTAALGPNLVGLKATDNAGNMATVNMTVNVAANTAPVLGVYPATGPINPGTSAAVTPSAAPTDNGFIASIAAAAPGFTGTFSVNTTTGVVNVSNAGPSGTYTVTVTATDNCGLTSTAMFQLIVNTPPTITPAATLNLTQGITSPGVAVATVGDLNTPAGSLIVTMESVAPPGVLVSNFVNVAGAITATVAVDCTAALGNHTVMLKVTDGGGLTTTANLIVNVLANPAPVQGNYSASNVNAGAGTTITPSAAPTDNGFITGIVASAPGFTGGFSVNTATGVITVTNAGPMGTFTVTVTATDNCGATSVKTFALTVNCPPITVNLPGVSSGMVSTPFSQSFTQTGGVGAVSFTVNSGVLPAGLILTADGVLSGTPTVTGTFPITVRATDSNGCFGISVTYNLVINCQTITVALPGASTGTVSAAFSQNFSQSGGVGAVTYTLNTGTLPTGLTLGTNGVISGTPLQSGNFPITVKVTDANGCMGVSPTYPLVIACQNIAVTPPVVTTGTVSAAFNQSFTQQGGIGAGNFTLNSGTLPTGLTLSTSGTLAGTPTQSGSFPLTVKYTDANGCMGVSPTYALVIGCQTITVTPPAVTTGTVNAPFNQSFTQTAGLGAVTFTLNTGTLPTGVTLAANGTLAGTPTQTGSFNITVKATDANGCFGISTSYTLVIGCQTITVTPPAVATGTIGAAFSQSFTQTGGVGAVTFTLDSGVLPTGLALSTAGLISGTPAQLGSFPIQVKATDANGCMGLSATYTLVISCQTITVTPPAVATGTVGTPFSQSFAQTGGLGAITFALNTGVLPTGMTLSSSGLLSGTPTQSGSFPITVKVTDVNGCMGISATYTLVIVCQTITVTAPAVATGTVGVPFSQTFTQAGALGNAANFTLNSGALPPGLVLALNGQLSGTPTQAGTFPITVKVTDGNGCTGVSATYTLVISCPTITIAPASLPNGTYGTAYSQTVTASPAGVWNYTVTAGALPNGLSLNATSGLISGTPNFVGTFNFTITAKYYDNCPATKAYTIVINCPVVTLAPANLLTGTIGLGYSQTVTASPAGTYNYAVTTGTLPPGVTINAATGVISGTPTLVGTFTFTITATGANDLAGCPGSKQYTIIINCRTVTISPTTLPGGKVGVAYNQTISATPAAAYAFTVSQGTLPPGLTLNGGTGVLSGTPTTLGTYNFTITATDPDTCPGSQPYSVVITCPVLVLSPTTLPTGTVGVLYQPQNFATTPAGTYSFSITSGTLPAGLSLTSAGLLSGTPTQSGSFPITVTATDANLCTGSRSYTLVINSCPPITVDPQTVVAGVSGSAYTQSFTATGGLAPYTFALSGSLPAGLSLSAAGVLSGTPTQIGSYSFTVFAKDANQCNGARAYTLSVTLGCTFGITPGGQSFAASGGTGTVAVTANSGCGWSATSSDPWITINSGASGTGNGSVAYTVAPDAATGVRVGTLVVAGQSFTITQTGVPRALADFDGDGKTDLSVWRGSVGNWVSINSSNNATQTMSWGAGYAPYNDVIVPGDYDGDGKTDQAIWRGQDSIWYIRKSSDGQPILKYWGANYAPYYDVPTPGDFDGDGKTDLAVWRPTSGTWYVQKSSNGGNLIEVWGQNGDIAVPGDYDGDGKCDFAVWRPSTGNWLIKLSSGGTRTIQWGAGYAPYNDVPVQADYDGDGKTDVAIWRGQDSIWYIRKSSDGQPILKYWGANYAPYNDVPVPGDFDGDGKADIAVWRPLVGTWFINRSSDNAFIIQVHGQSGDVPVPGIKQ